MQIKRLLLSVILPAVILAITVGGCAGENGRREVFHLKPKRLAGAGDAEKHIGILAGI
jgi:hypothetical protein